MPSVESDAAVAIWVMSQGHRIAYATESEVTRVRSETARMVFNTNHREAMALKRIYLGARFRLLDLVRLDLCNVMTRARHALRQEVLGRTMGEIARFRWMQLWGTYRGFALSGPLPGRLKRHFRHSQGFDWKRRSGRTSAAPMDHHETVPGVTGAKPQKGNSAPHGIGHPEMPGMGICGQGGPWPVEGVL